MTGARSSAFPPREAPARGRLTARTAFAVVWVAVQAALVLTAGRRAEGSFGFRMFPEASRIRAHLDRIVVPRRGGAGARPERVPVQGGTWFTHDRSGSLLTIHWRDRVREGTLDRFDLTMAASYTVAAQVARFHQALDYVARHIPDDADTRALVLTIDATRNNHETVHYEFTSDVPENGDGGAGGAR